MTIEKSCEEYAHFVDKLFKYYVKVYPFFLTYKGGNVKGIQPVSYEENFEVIEKFKAFLREIQEFNDALLSECQKNSKKCLVFMLTTKIENFKHFWLQFPLVPYTCSEIFGFSSFSDFKFRENDDLEDYLHLLDDLAQKLDDLLVFTKTQVKKGILIPKPELELVIPMWQSYTNPTEKNLLFVSGNRLKVYDENTKQSFVNSMKNKCFDQLVPRFNAIVSYLNGDYKDLAPNSVGLWQYLGGKEAYINSIKTNISYEWTPEEIHQLGLDQIQFLNKQIEEIMSVHKIKGNVDSIYQKINTDPAYCNQPPEKIKERYEKFLKSIKKFIPTIFNLQPETPGIVERLSPIMEESMTFGYYEPPVSGRKEGKYYFNASNVGGKLYLQIPAIALHELYPGHHFQIMLTMENENLNEFQKLSFDNSYVEGWAEYASNLGFEYNIITDPMDKIGNLFGRKMFAIRLVVDTGLNYLKWPLEDARKFMKENHFGDEAMINTESLRYSCDMPAQALAYRIGFLQIYKFRDEFRRLMGEKFDIKKFHEAVLEYGAQPLIILEQHLREKCIEWRGD